MATQIKAWQVANGTLRPLNTTLEEQGRKEGEHLERMVEWMSDNYDIGINAVLLRYSRTSSGDEMIMQTTVVPEEVVREKTKRQRKFQIPMSDEPGNYPMDELRSRWKQYLAGGSDTATWIRQILLPACLQSAKVSRETIKQQLVQNHFADDLQKAGFQLSVISGQFGRAQNDFLRQVIGYEYPNNPWEKENYHIRDGYREFAKELVQN